MPLRALDGGQGRRGRFGGGEVWFAGSSWRRVGGGGELDALAIDWGPKRSEKDDVEVGGGAWRRLWFSEILKITS